MKDATDSQAPKEQLEIEFDGDELALMERYHAWGWTDGLPIVVPTPARVEEMCAGARHYPAESLGELAPRGGIATVQKIAINAVMAGCRPAYMPVIETAVLALLEPSFNLFGIQTTTHPCAALVIVHGPVATALGMSSGHGCFGPGNRANASIGRALRLILQNIGGAIPGQTDKATQGTPAKYTYCFAENEAASPWPPFRASLGFGFEESCVTVAAAEGPHNVNDHRSTSAEGILTSMAQTMATGANNNLYQGGDLFVVFGPEHAETVAHSGFSREDVQSWLFEHARVSVDRFSPEKLDELMSWGRYGDRMEEWGGRIPLVREAEHIRVLVAGGAGKHSCWIPTFGIGLSQTRKIDDETDLCGP
jgi:hypothetical protein